MDSLYTAVDYICAILVAGVLGMIAFSHKEHQAARLMLLAAGGLTIVRWTMWSLNTGSPWWIRGIIGALLGAMLLILMPALWQWSKAKIADNDKRDANTTLKTPAQKAENALTKQGDEEMNQKLGKRRRDELLAADRVIEKQKLPTGVKEGQSSSQPAPQPQVKGILVDKSKRIFFKDVQIVNTDKALTIKDSEDIHGKDINIDGGKK